MWVVLLSLANDNHACLVLFHYAPYDVGVPGALLSTISIHMVRNGVSNDRTGRYARSRHYTHWVGGVRRHPLSAPLT